MEEFLLRSVQHRVSPTTAASSTKTYNNGQHRYGVTITAYASPVYVRAVVAGASDPSASSSDYDWIVPLGTSIDRKVGESIDLWVQTAGNYSMVTWS